MAKRITTERLTEVLEHALKTKPNITARSTARALGVPASTLTRNADRKNLIAQYAKKQSDLKIAKADNKDSREKLLNTIIKHQEKITSLERTITILTAAHKAMLVALGSYGGARAWREFFPVHQSVKDEINELING